ncbi:DUF6456 domain-containing protein [Roseovarius mucosus]|uniref:Helix-turn-helix domain containing protein n=1 Tax=Roseovarius mucosus TaxID=215743 RepID=A0A1V0RUI5_9RHOB|nr:DUF6456 domain-containing protein [Roseovarius mucosus]ARE85438.1 helix-turn-helix domain containing protein [Roseovarius mucosus]MBW4974907.1 helix-turn-helix domain containing protein [Roseovarius mucosus]|tara:strand:+ start:512 stop:1627 length:1116 start_codon:yes stop_codon:yes gene_type:complete
MHEGYAFKTILHDVPSWVPEAALHYLAHTESGTPIRALARHAGRHASTVMRQIRAYETRRDDLLVDEALRRLGQRVNHDKISGSPAKEAAMTSHTITRHNQTPELTENRLKSEARRVLRRLCEPGALLAVSADMDKAVVVRDTGSGQTLRTAVVEREVAEAMALKGWVACDGPGRIARYHITATGRNALSLMLAEAENQASGLRDGPFLSEQAASHPTPDASGRRARYGLVDSPLVALARRRDKDGSRFLTSDLVRAGERLREDFELAQMAPRVAQNWDHFLSHVDEHGSPVVSRGYDAEAARLRVLAALRDLGPGLGDVVLRCCCYMEGLERAEKKMGWSARSGKIVLRIALQRLKRHYEGLGEAGSLIG